MMFSKEQLRKLIIPLVVEQFLAMAVGMLDTIMVSSLGETAVSGVSLVDSINILLFQVFAALATGGAVVASQYIGKGDEKAAKKSAKQLVLTAFSISAIITIITLFFYKSLLSLAFGSIEEEVRIAAETYFVISAISYPFIALYNSGAALFRSMNNSNISMKTSLVMNIMNFCGNYLLIFVIPLGVAGAAISTLVARIFGALYILYLLKNQKLVLSIDSYLRVEVDFNCIKKILAIGIPTGLENGMFQFGKIIVQSLIATFGTYAITANAVANNFAGIMIIPGSAIGLGLVTVVGQCVGANKYDEAKVYIMKLMKLSYLTMIILSAIIILFAPQLLLIYGLSDLTKQTAYILLCIHGLMGMVFWPVAFTFPNALRAAGDAKFTMIVSIISMWLFRVVASYFIAGYLQIGGVVTVWVCMTIDWVFRAILFVLRYRSGKWMNKAIV